MAEDDEAMSGYPQNRSLEAKRFGATGGLAKTAKKAERASRIASARAEKAEKDAQRAAAAVLGAQPLGAGDSEEEEDETHTDVAELEAKDMEELTALGEAWGGVPARVAARETRKLCADLASAGGEGDSEEEEDETHTDVAELEAKDMEELTALREAWGGLPARVAAREAYFKFLLSWRWELKAVDRKNAAD